MAALVSISSGLFPSQPQLSAKIMKPTKYHHPKYDINTLLSSPHDMSHQEKHMAQGK